MKKKPRTQPKFHGTTPHHFRDLHLLALTFSGLLLVLLVLLLILLLVVAFLVACVPIAAWLLPLFLLLLVLVSAFGPPTAARRTLQCLTNKIETKFAGIPPNFHGRRSPNPSEPHTHTSWL